MRRVGRVKTEVEDGAVPAPHGEPESACSDLVADVVRVAESHESDGRNGVREGFICPIRSERGRLHPFCDAGHFSQAILAFSEWDT